MHFRQNKIDINKMCVTNKISLISHGLRIPVFCRCLLNSKFSTTNYILKKNYLGNSILISFKLKIVCL